MSILLTGAAGFIGMHTARRLLDRGERVIGIDVLNAYYDPALKQARLATLEGSNAFTFEKMDFSDRDAVLDLVARNPDIDRVVHLGAQAGVRYSLEEPFDYLSSNLTGQLVLMEACRAMMDRDAGCRSFVYASSSSVYGANREMPFSIDQRTDHPMSFYGATKKAGEVMAQSYAHLYAIPSIGLRFFTVYGPWGRPDMSPYIFTSKIMNGETIQVFNNGEMSRDFTYVDDIVTGVIAALDTPPKTGQAGAPHRVYNLGNNRPVPLMDYIGVIERACGRQAIIDFRPLQPGDVLETYADIDATTQDLGFAPTTSIEEGIPRFVEWYRGYHEV
ncbi:MAG: SDR family NAD(P)-dependent oxidoreductase [Alphaproteobacteria bacterium]|jgi:UDP-glucuronate 4-epimerase|nr:SDR family NAD(P)-dependent oxidoreductase [Alphaproteobacteria bacterium]